jgi:hypothetical protein
MYFLLIAYLLLILDPTFAKNCIPGSEKEFKLINLIIRIISMFFVILSIFTIPDTKFCNPDSKFVWVMSSIIAIISYLIIYYAGYKDKE